MKGLLMIKIVCVRSTTEKESFKHIFMFGTAKVQSPVQDIKDYLSKVLSPIIIIRSHSWKTHWQQFLNWRWMETSVAEFKHRQPIFWLWLAVRIKWILAATQIVELFEPSSYQSRQAQPNDAKMAIQGWSIVRIRPSGPDNRPPHLRLPPEKIWRNNRGCHEPERPRPLVFENS